MNLRDYLFLKRITIKEFAQIMDYSRTHMTAIANGKTNASMKLAKRIEKFTDGVIKAEDLTTQVKDRVM